MDPIKTVLVLCCCSLYLVSAFPRKVRQDAEVIKISDPIAPIVTDPLETPSLEPRSNTSTAESSSSAQPTPVPADQPITTEQLPPSSPSLVPSVVEISTQDPQNVPPPPANATTPQPAEEDEESDEDDSDEEEDEEGEGGEDEDEDEDEEEEDEEEEDEKINVIGRKGKDLGNEEINGSFKEHKVQLGSVVVVDEDKVSDEEDGASVPVKEEVKINKNLEKLAVGGSSALQSVPARTPTNEDDEVELSPNQGGSVVLAVVKS